MALRRAGIADAPAIALLHRRVVRDCLPYLPDLHTAEEDLWFFTERFLPEHEVWVWEEGGIKAYCGFRRDWLDHLYVDRSAQGQGVGSALLDKAKSENSRLQLWVFQKNAAAIGFYEQHGFRLVETTDGAGNEEKEPDARYEWRRTGSN